MSRKIRSRHQLSTALITARREEFFTNVWNHTDDIFQASFDERRPLNRVERIFLRELSRRLKDDPSSAGDDVLIWLRKKILSNPAFIELVLQLSGLTRNKILQDIRARAGSTTLSLSNHRTLAVKDATWAYAGPYLMTRLRTILVPNVFEALNQATWPGYIRQERAKRSGHEAEYRIAVLLNTLGIPFEPEEKKDNPLCRDIQFLGVSFDLVIPNAITPRVCVKSTVHTANIGQYGESKDHLEILEAKRAFSFLSSVERPLLLAFIDGVGFRSNRAGLDGVLANADEFCQFNTMWKIVVLATGALGWNMHLALPDSAIKKHADFLAAYRSHVKVVPLIKRYKGVAAGEGLVLTLTSDGVSRSGSQTVEKASRIHLKKSSDRE